MKITKYKIEINQNDTGYEIKSSGVINPHLLLGILTDLKLDVLKNIRKQKPKNCVKINE